MYAIGLCLIVFVAVAATSFALFTGPHAASGHWIRDEQFLGQDETISFFVGLQIQNANLLHDELMSVSNPRSPNYGKYHSQDYIQRVFGPSEQSRNSVMSFLSAIPNVKVDSAENGDFLKVTATVGAIEEFFQTKLSWRKQSNNLTTKRAVRADESLSIPDSVASHMSFISLNSPIAHLIPRYSKSAKSSNSEKEIQQMAKATHADAAPSVTSGNKEALLNFKPICLDGQVNMYSSPCFGQGASQPTFKAVVTPIPNNISVNEMLTNSPTVFPIPTSSVYCANTYLGTPCNGPVDQKNCTCTARISPLPMYTQLKANLTYSFDNFATTNVYGVTPAFALTDVMTASILNDLYDIPAGTTVRYGSNMSVVEFYSEFYSNSDLAAFMRLSGLPTASISESNVLGNLPNDQNDPGGEAQLDVEYIMALAPGAETYFYSYSNRNPYFNEDEGFLQFLTDLSAESNPPLVVSFSYGDVESEVFDTTNGANTYAESCEVQFQKLGLRGISLIFSSGDDGIGNFLIRNNVTEACAVAQPAWPASSPYVTTVGATQLTDKYLPVCGSNYASAAFGMGPAGNQLMVECTGTKETTCSSTIGGIITSGGGFSNVNSRSLAPWQNEAVDNYLQQSGATPPDWYFNVNGRGYPDVATYGSNYFVYINGQITRESGTSASAPVFAAMVTLWNDMRIAYGMPPMGFVAPFLYSIYSTNPEAFHDVTTGDNACGAGRSIETVNCCPYSFAATAGWDAVTGLGTPNFEVISNLVLNASNPFPGVAASSGLSFPETTDNDDDDSVNAKVDAALAIGIVGFVFGLASCMYLIIAHTSNKAEASSGELKKPLIRD